MRLWVYGLLRIRQQSGNSLIHGFGQYADAFEQCLARGSEGRGNFHGLPPSADRGEQEQTFLETALDDRVGEVVIGLFGPGFDGLDTAHQPSRGNMANHLGMLVLDCLQTFQQHRTKARRVAG